jgi:hypothetical protein
MTAPHPTPRRARLFSLSLAALVFLAGAQTTSAAGLSGCWTGHWQSCTSGHKGPLNATFCKLDETRYRVEFTGRFFKLIPFRYEVTLNVVTSDGDTVTLSGSSYLGRMFGTFTYSATATGCEFVANYSSCKDRGQFVLHRACAPCR